ncbi:hypothetical protein [Sphingomonas sp. 37zxx]|uniref:hypothetical protein n=1 Tax=Sphingomonas sp. 37zxx TaxID=1550073 RepID=UPI00053BDE8D|nr:hypothetical protein [Sphingomonas sp. 37zxx]
MRALVAASLGLALFGCAATPEQMAASEAQAAAQFAKVTRGLVAGEPQQCLPSLNPQGPQIIGNDVMIYRQIGAELWVTNVEGCPSLDDDSIVIAEIFGGQMCRNDRFQTLPRGGVTIPSAFCRLGMFTPYRKPAK